MIKISRQIDYALQLIFALNKQQNGEFLSLKRFSQESTISFLFLQKIARQLRQAGIVEAAKGARGGYVLIKPADSINLKTVAEAIEGPYGVSNCHRPGEVCSQLHQCSAKDGLKMLQTQVILMMEKMTVADMAKSA